MTARRKCPGSWVGVATGRVAAEVQLTLGHSKTRFDWIMCYAPGTFVADSGEVILPPIFHREALAAWIWGSAATGDRGIATVFAALGFDVPIPDHEFRPKHRAPIEAPSTGGAFVIPSSRSVGIKSASVDRKAGRFSHRPVTC